MQVPIGVVLQTPGSPFSFPPMATVMATITAGVTATLMARVKATVEDVVMVMAMVMATVMATVTSRRHNWLAKHLMVCSPDGETGSEPGRAGLDSVVCGHGFPLCLEVLVWTRRHSILQEPELL